MTFESTRGLDMSAELTNFRLAKDYTKLLWDYLKISQKEIACSTYPKNKR